MHIDNEGRIFLNGEYVGYLADGHVFVVTSGHAVDAGEYEHRSEVRGIIEEYMNNHEPL
jgi:hypothetical protein